MAAGWQFSLSRPPRTGDEAATRTAADMADTEAGGEYRRGGCERRDEQVEGATVSSTGETASRLVVGDG